jgi:hypothetical protein
MQKKQSPKPIDLALLEKVLGGSRSTIPPIGVAIPQPAFSSFYHS